MSEKFIARSLKILVVIIFTCTILKMGISMFIMNDKEKLSNEFLGTIKSPTYYHIVDYEKMESKSSQDLTPKLGNLSILEENVENLDAITDILNSKKLTPTTYEEYSSNYNNKNKKVKFCLMGVIDSDSTSKNYFAYDVFIQKDKTIYINVRKDKESLYLKSAITDDEYKYIQELYNDLFEEKFIKNK